MVFFAMACIGWFNGSSPATGASRAFFGAVIAYITISMAGRAVGNIIIDAMVENKISKMAKDNQ